MSSKQSRRDFMQWVGTGAAVLASGGALAQDGGTEASAGMHSKEKEPGTLPRRPLGKTGVQVSVLAMGGYHLGTLPSADEAARLVHEAMDHGLDFFDNAYEYNQGQSEFFLGKALEGGRRQRAFVMTKVCTHGRDKRTAVEQLDASLKRLKTDYLDLWQVHEVVYPDDPAHHYTKEGVLEALTQAKKDGKVRFVGFTGHKSPDIHLDMLKRGYAFDTVQMPLNPLDGTFRSFEQNVLPVVQKRGMAALGMKSLGGSGDVVRKGLYTPEESIRYVLSLPVAALVSGIDSREVLHQNLRIASTFQPMSPEEMRALRERLKPVAAKGEYELYKTTRQYDAEVGRAMHNLPLKG